MILLWELLRIYVVLFISIEKLEQTLVERLVWPWLIWFTFLAMI